MDIVKDLRGFEIDHLPDGWPAVKMRQISALCDEAERLRDMLRPEWDSAGEAATLAAAAEDADEWMALIERLHNNGRGPWKFSEPDSLEKLRGCRRALRRFLTPNYLVSPREPDPWAGAVDYRVHPSRRQRNSGWTGPAGKPGI